MYVYPCSCHHILTDLDIHKYLLEQKLSHITKIFMIVCYKLVLFIINLNYTLTFYEEF